MSRQFEDLHFIMARILEERDRQDRKWGIQHHPDGTDREWESQASWYKFRNDTRNKQGNITWADILLEEVMESLAETDQGRLRAELIQSAAVIVAWLEDIDGRLE